MVKWRSVKIRVLRAGRDPPLLTVPLWSLSPLEQESRPQANEWVVDEWGWGKSLPTLLAQQPAKLKALLPPCVQRMKGKGNVIRRGLRMAQREPCSWLHTLFWRAHTCTQRHFYQDDQPYPLGVCHPSHSLPVISLEVWVPGSLLWKAELAQTFLRASDRGLQTEYKQAGNSSSLHVDSASRASLHSDFGEHCYRERQAVRLGSCFPRCACSHTTVTVLSPV